MKIGIVGTGYVGLTTGLSLSNNGHFSYFIDVDENKIKLINESIAPFFEKGIEESLIDLKDKYKATGDKSVYNDLDILFVAVPTPEKKDGSTDLRFIDSVLEDIVKNRTSSNKFLIVIKSTVPVGTNRKIQMLLNDKKLNGEVASNPEFLSQGTALWDSLNPNRIIIGTQSKWARDILEDIYSNFKSPILNMSLESAELVKYASNSFQALKVSYINEIANIAEVTNGNIDHIAKAMGYDPVIGNKFLKSGIGYGGSCFPKDTKSLVLQARNVGIDAKIVNSVVETNQYQVTKIANLVLKEKGKIGILGLSFKPGTDDIRETPAHYITQVLNKKNIVPYAYDPKASKNYVKMFPEDKIVISQSIKSLISQVDNIILVTDWQEFKDLDENIFNGKKVFDGRRIYPWAYYRIGEGFKNKC